MTESDDLKMLTTEGLIEYTRLTERFGVEHEIAFRGAVKLHGTKSFDQLMANRMAEEQAEIARNTIKESLAKQNSLRVILGMSTITPAQAVKLIESAGWFYGGITE